MTTPKTTQEIFETQACGRCGGSGHYSYCQMYGTKCFKCAGRAWEFTKHGQQDYNRWREAVDAVTVKPVTELKVGDYCKAWSDFRKYVKVVAIEVTASGCYDITFDREIAIPTPVGVAKQRSFNVAANDTVRIHPGNELMPKAEDFVTPHYRKCKGCRKLYAEQPSVYNTCPACAPAAAERAEAAYQEHLRQEAEIARQEAEKAEAARLEAERREAEKAARIAEKNALSNYFGTPGQRETFALTLKRIIPIEGIGYTGRSETRYLHILEDAQGNAAVWFTGSELDAPQGVALSLKATVKEHREYNGQKQTVLTRVVAPQEAEG